MKMILLFLRFMVGNYDALGAFQIIYVLSRINRYRRPFRTLDFRLLLNYLSLNIWALYLITSKHFDVWLQFTILFESRLFHPIVIRVGILSGIYDFRVLICSLVFGFLKLLFLLLYN